MPYYYLKLRSGFVSFSNDPDPEEFASLDDARAGALKNIRELANLSALSGRPLQVEAIDITTEDGGVLVTVPVSGVIANGNFYHPPK